MSEDLILDYLPIFIFMLAVGVLGIGMLVASHVIGLFRKNSNDEKTSTYECGMTPIKDARRRFDIRFYLVAMLFIIFDIEVVFLYPWAILFDKFNPVIFGFIEMIIFIVVLLFGYVYIWRKGALDWR